MRSGIQANLPYQPARGVNGWHLFVDNADIDAAYEIQAKAQASAYAQISAAEEIEVLSADAGDTTQKLTIYGIENTYGNRVHEVVSMNGATVVTTTTVWRYFEGAMLDSECAGAVTIRKATGDTFISGITVGDLSDYVCQHFNGEHETFVTMFAVGVNDNIVDSVTFDLRWYPDDADSLDSGDGFVILDRIVCIGMPGGVEQMITQPAPHVYPQGIRCPAGGWLVVFGLGGAANCSGYVTLQGFDV